jgi:hypothetical protein
MTGMVGNKWSFDDFSPMEVIPTAVCLTTYDGGAVDFMLTPLDELVEQVAAGAFCTCRSAKSSGSMRSSRRIVAWKRTRQPARPSSCLELGSGIPAYPAKTAGNQPA